MSAPRSAWRRLGIEPTKEVAAIRSAYAAVLKSIDPDTDPAGFEALRRAREQALAHARRSDAEIAEDVADSHDVEVPPVAWSGQGLSAPLLPEGTIPGDVAASVPAADGDFRWVDRPEQVEGEERVVPLAGASGSLTPPVLSGGPAVATIDSREPSVTEAHEAHYQAVLAILFGEDGRIEPLTDETVRRELITHVEALLHDPRMAEIAFYADAERWFAQIVAASAPRSDAILHMVLDQFGWLSDRGRIDQPAETAAVVARYDMLAFHTAVQKRDHPLHGAWRELITPADETTQRGFVNRKKVSELLALVRRDYPDLEQAFDWYRVALWETGTSAQASSSSWNLSWLRFLWPAFILLTALARCSTPDVPTSPVFTVPTTLPTAPALPQLDEILVTPEHDIGEALSDVSQGTLTFTELARKNPGLAKILEDNWHRARESDQVRATFLRETRTSLRDRFYAGLKKASYPVISDYRAFQRDEARLAGSRSMYACDDYFRGGALPMSRSPLYDRRLSNMVARGLVEANVAPVARKKPTTFIIPNAAFEDAVKRSGLAEQRFADAMQDKGSADERCKARIALLEAALAMPPRTGLKLLRDM
jgi:hypothetical protein